MVDVKIPIGMLMDALKDETNGLNIANDVKEQIVEYFETIVAEEIKNVSKWAKEVTELQGKRTLQDKDWKFILQKIQKE